MYPKRIVIVGTGLAGLRAAETLRADGFDGAVTLAGAEPDAPYDRPPLSKQVLTGDRKPEEVFYRKPEFYTDHAIDLRLGRCATGIDLNVRALELGATRIPFDALVIATGAAARPLTAGTHELGGIFSLRTLADARALTAALNGSPQVVVIGAGFIGAEVASSARALGLTVTVVEAQPTPLSRAVGRKLGAVCGELHWEHGTSLRCGVTVAKIEGNGRVERLTLSDGATISADIVVAGIGVDPNAAWLNGSGLAVADGVVCDETLNAGAPGVYAAGDVARWTNPLFGIEMRCENWTNAAEQGRHVARNILAGPGGAQPYAGANYFWSDQYGVRIQFAGISTGEEIVVIHGDPQKLKFVALYRRGDRVVGALGIDSPRLVMKAKNLIERRATWPEALAALDAAG